MIKIYALLRASKIKTVLHNFWLTNFALLFPADVSGVLAWKLAAKSNEKLVNQRYATLYLSWMPFTYYFSLNKSFVLQMTNFNSNILNS